MNASKQIDQQIAELGGWRGQLYSQIRQLIRAADPDIEETWKWGTAVFTCNGNVCAVGAFKDHVKINFFQGASLADPLGLFNAGLDAKLTRGIDYYEDDVISESALTDLIHAAVASNQKK